MQVDQLEGTGEYFKLEITPNTGKLHGLNRVTLE